MTEPQEIGRMTKLWQKIWNPIDPWLFIAMMAVYIMSLFLLYSADGQEFGQLENKTLHTVIGFAVLWLVAQVNPKTIAKLALPIYIVGVILLIGVEVAGEILDGAECRIADCCDGFGGGTGGIDFKAA